MSKLLTLEHLKIQDCHNLSSTCLQSIGVMMSLKYLYIWPSENMRPTDAEFAHLGNLKSLQTLVIVGMRKLTDASLGVIGKLTGIEKLDISGCREFTDEGLVHLAALPNLLKYCA